jgi:HAD superfamily hydrolase (TIGR01450 family)
MREGSASALPPTRGNVVCDLDGVVYLGDTPVSGAGPALAEIDRRGYRLVFATNAPLRTPEAVAHHIASLTGYAASPPQVLTSAMVAAETLSVHDAPVLVVGEEGLALTLAHAGFSLTKDPAQARAVVVGLDRHLTYNRLRVAADALRRGARFVATNRDATYPTESGLWPGGGAVVAALEAATGRTAEVVGKPYPPMRDAVLRRLAPGPTWVVGDRPETDLALGHDQGWTTVLVLSGVVGDPAEVPPALRPDLVLETIADLPAHLPG